MLSKLTLPSQKHGPSSYMTPKIFSPSFSVHHVETRDLEAPCGTRLGRMLVDMTLSLFLEMHLIPVVVERDDGVDGIAELRHQQERLDSFDEVLCGRVNGPIAFEHRVADAIAAIDVRVVDGVAKRTFGGDIG